MARKQGRGKSKAASPDPWDGRALDRWLQSMAGRPWRRWLRRAMTAMGVAILVAGSWYGLGRLDRHVRTLPRYSTPLSFRIVNPPTWSQALPIEREVLAELEPLRGVSLLDEGLVERAADLLRDNPWVQRLVRVDKRYGGQVAITCEFRRPIAAIQRGTRVAWVDVESVRLPVLPGRNDTLMWVDGIRSSAPAVGRPWVGDDVAAAVRLASMLIDEPYASQIAALSFENYGGRLSRLEPQIKLITVNGHEILWGFAPGEEIEEPGASQKIALLRRINRQFKQIDTNRAWVNLTKGTDRIGRARSTGLGVTARNE